jgi:hypothetical protein
VITQLRQFDVTIPAGTAKAVPLVTSVAFPPRVVKRIDWLFPHGCNGNVGIQIGARNVPVLPGNVNQFITRSGDSAGVNVDDMPTTGDWSVIGYNTGTHDHTIHFTFMTEAIPPPVSDRFIVDSASDILGMGES